MKKFNKIVVLDNITGLSENFVEKISEFSENKVVFYNEDPKNDDEIINRINNADCILVSWRTEINENILDKCTKLNFIALCWTNSNLIDFELCNKKNITISNVSDYWDEWVTEWIFLELLKIFRWTWKNIWKNKVNEISKKTIWIIWFWAVWKILANIALGFNMNVLCYTRTKNLEFEKKGVHFIDKKELLEKSDIITLHTPKNVKILEKNDFDLMKEKILVNTTLWKAFDENDFKNWIKQNNNFAIFDMVSDFWDSFKNLDRVIYKHEISWKTNESIIRLHNKVIENIKVFK